MLVTVFPIVILVLGVLIWALAGNPLVKEAGRIMFFCGLLVLTLSLAHVTWRVGDSGASWASREARTVV